MANKYERFSKQELRVDPSKATYCGPFVVERLENGKRSIDSNGENEFMLYEQEADAKYVLSQMNKASREKRVIRPATEDEVQSGVVVRPKRKRHNCLVEIFEDFDTRRFAISSRAENEGEFIVEFSTALSSMGDVFDEAQQITRMRELLPLAIDICCKYRGYKTDRVQQRMFLIAGDLDVPSVQFDARGESESVNFKSEIVA